MNKISLTILFVLISLFVACNVNTTDSIFDNPYQTYRTFSHSSGKEITYAVILPELYDASAAYPVLLALPPGEQRKSQVQWAINKYWIRRSIQKNWIVISPVSPGFVTLFHTGNETLIPEFMDMLEQEYNVEGGKFHVAGISNGGLSGFKITLNDTARVRSLTVFPGVPPEESDYNRLQRLQNIEVAIYVGALDSDDWVNETARTITIFDSLGVNYTTQTFANDGHVINSITSEFLFTVLDGFRVTSN